ncbi:MAG TPA: choice-of-anchor D domain-containing protein [Solirubrobacteraceae bacterium]|nr:choice-of-anchor D domain-containing protein [Solirubrobacteraceae bacterium]
MSNGVGALRAARRKRRAATALAALCGLALVAALAMLALAGTAQASGTSAVTTAAYGNLRDDWDANEPALAPATLQSGSFGELFTAKLKGAIYGQPLVFDDTVVVSTEKAMAYGVNASSGAIEWTRSFGTPFKASTVGCSDLTPDIGSTSTPVIEPTSGTVYLTTRLQSGKGIGNSHWYMQALSATTGEEKAGFPVQLSGTPANTPGVPFNEHYAQQRPALLLLNGVVYAAFASDCDITPYRGVVVGVNASSGAITTMWSDESGVGTDESSQAGIWQSGGGLVSDFGGRIVLATGNGVSPSPAAASHPPATLSESVVGLTVGAKGELTPSQFFAPSNAPTLDQNDEDFGSGGPIALPSEFFGTSAIPHLLVQVGKDGRIFLLNGESMGGYRQGAKGGDAVLQSSGPFGGVWGHPAAYGGQGGWVYVLESAGGGVLRALSYGLNGKGEPALSSAATSSESFGYTSGSPLVTSNGTTSGSGVVWVEYASGPSGKHGQLRAYAASPSGATLALLYSHSIGTASKFAVPTAAEGRVYVGTRSGKLIVFGATGGAAAQAAPAELGAVPVGESQTSTVSVSANKEVTVTGPVTAAGEQGNASAREVEAGEAAEASAASTKGSGRSKKPHLTAGPKRIPPSGNTAIAGGVIVVHQPRLGTAIVAGATLRLRVTFRPRRAGPVVGELLIHTSAGTLAVPMSGYGTAPGLALSAPPLAFRKIATGVGGKALGVTFANSWNRPERITGVRLPRGPFTVSGLPAPGTVLAPRQAITASVLFDPSRAGRYPTRLGIAVDGRLREIPISASAVSGHARLVASSTSIDAGAVKVGQSKTLEFTIADRGTVPLTISRAIAPLGAFSAVVALPEGITLEPGFKLHVQVTFRPSAPGPDSGEYRFNSNAGGGYTTVRFSGRGV